MERAMVTAARKLSQVTTHMAIGFAIMYAMTGSLVFGGMAVLVEPVINVLLLPLHERLWAGIRARSAAPALSLAGEKLSQTAMHMAGAFAVIAAATGSMNFGGVAAGVAAGLEGR